MRSFAESRKTIEHAKTFYPDVARKGKFEAMDFFAETDENDKNKYRAVVFCSALHDMPDLRAALLKTKYELLNTEKPGSRLVIVHAQGASHVLNQNKQRARMPSGPLELGFSLAFYFRCSNVQ